MNYIFEEILSFLIFICSSLPGRIGIYSRKILYKFLIKNIGKDFYTENGVVFSGYKNIIIGNNVRLMRYSSINADDGIIKLGNNISINYNVNINSSGKGSIIFGDNVLVGQNTVFRSADHIFKKDQITYNNTHVAGKIIIGNNVWIGANCVILKNVIIGDNCVIGANSTITKNIEKNKVVVGLNKVIKEI